MDAKASLIRKALGAEQLTIQASDGTVRFPWWDALPEPEETKAYTAFLAALCRMAKEAKRVTATEKAVESEKYAFRGFLLRLGFIGADCKEQRKLNKLSADRTPLLADLREIQKTYSGTDGLEQTLRELDERLNREADAVQDLIATNARVAQNQDEYNAQYDTLVSGYEATKKERDRVAAEIRQKGIRRREFQRFITALENLPEEVTEFEEGMWSDLVECMAVYAKDDLRFMLPCETEIMA